MNINFKRLISLAVLVGAIAGSLAGCNTIEGAGKDLEKAGEEVQEEANDNR